MLPKIYHYFQNSPVFNREEIIKWNVQFNLTFDHFCIFFPYELIHDFSFQFYIRLKWPLGKI